jgi:hypothetical protein
MWSDGVSTIRASGRTSRRTRRRDEPRGGVRVARVGLTPIPTRYDEQGPSLTAPSRQPRRQPVRDRRAIIPTRRVIKRRVGRTRSTPIARFVRPASGRSPTQNATARIGRSGLAMCVSQGLRGTSRRGEVVRCVQPSGPLTVFEPDWSSLTHRSFVPHRVGRHRPTPPRRWILLADESGRNAVRTGPDFRLSSDETLGHPLIKPGSGRACFLARRPSAGSAVGATRQWPAPPTSRRPRRRTRPRPG